MTDEYLGKLELTDNCSSCTAPLMHAQRNRKAQSKALESKDASQTECTVTLLTSRDKQTSSCGNEIAAVLSNCLIHFICFSGIRANDFNKPISFVCFYLHLLGCQRVGWRQSVIYGSKHDDDDADCIYMWEKVEKGLKGSSVADAERR